MRSLALLVRSLPALAGLSFAPARAPSSAAVPAPGAADSLVRDGVACRGRLAVVPTPSGPALDVRVRLRNVGRDTTTVETAASSCHPPLYLRPLSRDRAAVWSDLAWQADVARRASGGSIGFACTGTGLRARLAPGGHVDLPPTKWPQRYPMRAVRGDSLPPGWYAAAVGVVVYEPAGTGAAWVDTIRVPAGRVRLP